MVSSSVKIYFGVQASADQVGAKIFFVNQTLREDQCSIAILKIFVNRISFLAPKKDLPYKSPFDLRV
jgi:exonuclease I